MVDYIHSIIARPLNVALKEPFNIATASMKAVSNVWVRVSLSSGFAGEGEAAVLYPVTPLGQAELLQDVNAFKGELLGLPIQDIPLSLRVISETLDDRPQIRAAVEQALVDAFARSQGVPMWTIFGQTGARIRTDMTIPICSIPESVSLARHYLSLGFQTLKLKVGIDYDQDVQRLSALQEVDEHLEFVLDANEGYTKDVAKAFIKDVSKMGVNVALFEQPVPRGDWDGMAELTRDLSVPIAADESVRNLADARRLIRLKACSVFNLKLAKLGLSNGCELVRLAQEYDKGLMMGAMVETRLGLASAAHMARGFGGFGYIDLDTAFLMATDPIIGGPIHEGPEYQFFDNTVGHGARLKGQDAHG